MPSQFKPSSLTAAWCLIGVWVLCHGALKFFMPAALDMDSAEQVYFAQSWQMGYGTRQPPLYTWLLLAFKPEGASWPLVLELARYACLLLWLGGVQMLARVCGAHAAVQARTLLLHLGLMLVMWRVHDSLTHTVLAACLTVWASVALVRALERPAWWLLVGLLGALACLAKLNGAVWCAASFVAAWAVILLGKTGQSDGPSGRDASPSPMAHLGWMLAALLVFAAVMAPYGQWWLSRPSSAEMARRVVLSDDGLPFWWPVVEVALGSLEYTLLGPFLIALVAWRLRPQVANGLATPGMRWLQWQTAVALVLLVAMLIGMQGSHFTPRWVWPVAPGLTVWLCVWALQRIDARTDGRGHKAAQVLCTLLPLLAILLTAVRVWEPAHNAKRCTNCWTDRPAQALSVALHAQHGPGPLRIITGDDHLGGILFQADSRDKAWTSHSTDLPPPQGFAASGSMPCVAAWLDMDQAKPAPAKLRAVVGQDAAMDAPHAVSMPVARAPQRHFWLSSVALPAAVCDRAPR